MENRIMDSHGVWVRLSRVVALSLMMTALVACHKTRFPALPNLGSLKALPASWEAPLRPGSETDPVALNEAIGERRIPDAETVALLRESLVMTGHSFSNLLPKVPQDGLFKVSRHFGPPVHPTMPGVGPFYLVKVAGTYHALTPLNFARLFGPLERVEEVLPYVRTYEKLYGNRLATVLYEDMDRGMPKGQSGFAGYAEMEPKFRQDIKDARAELAERRKEGLPSQIEDQKRRLRDTKSGLREAQYMKNFSDWSTVKPAKGGYEVRLVLSNAAYRRVVYEKRLQVSHQGIVTERGTKVLRDFASGIIY